MAEEMLLHALPIAYAATPPLGAATASAPTAATATLHPSSGWSPERADALLAQLLLSPPASATASGGEGPGGDAIVAEALDLLAYYVDIHSALAPITALGVGCDAVPVPAEPAFACLGGAKDVRPLGLAGACGVVMTLMAARAAMHTAALGADAAERLRILCGAATQPIVVVIPTAAPTLTPTPPPPQYYYSRALASLTSTFMELAAVAATGQVPIPAGVEAVLAACVGAVAGAAAESVAAAPAPTTTTAPGGGSSSGDVSAASVLCDQAAGLCEGLALRCSFACGHALRQRYLQPPPPSGGASSSSSSGGRAVVSARPAWALVQDRSPAIAAAITHAQGRLQQQQQQQLRSRAAAVAGLEGQNADPLAGGVGVKEGRAPLMELASVQGGSRKKSCVL